MNAKCKDTSRCSVNQEIAALLVLAKFEMHLYVSHLNSIGWALSCHSGNLDLIWKTTGTENTRGCTIVHVSERKSEANKHTCAMSLPIASLVVRR